MNKIFIFSFLFLTTSCSYKILPKVNKSKMVIRYNIDDLQMEQVSFEICKENMLCLDKNNSIILNKNLNKISNFIKYIKETYKTDINTYNNIINL